jgi:hypothetical protein
MGTDMIDYYRYIKSILYIEMVYRATKRQKTLRKRKGRRSFKKYRGGEKPPGSVRSVSSGSSSGSSGFRSFSQRAVNIGRRNILKPFASLNLNAANEEYTRELCGTPTGKGLSCPCTKGSSNFARKISGTTECGPGTTCKYDESNSIKATNGVPRYTCQDI